VKREGKRQGIYTEIDQLAWLYRKADTGGFRVMDAQVVSDDKQRAITKDRHETVFAAVLFTGVLEVTDCDLFMATLESGIGSAKGFGFGLLSIAPVRM
jgi:CRISPR system Cascade subunit CasE